MIEQIGDFLKGSATTPTGAAMGVLALLTRRAPLTDAQSPHDFRMLARSPRPFLLTDALGVVTACNEAAVTLAQTSDVTLGVGTRVRRLFGNNADADALLYKAMRQVTDTGAFIATLPFPMGLRGTALRAEISDCGSGSCFLWSLELINLEKAVEAEPAITPMGMESAPVGYFSADRGGSILELNVRMRELTGIGEDALARGELNLSDIFGESARRLSPALAREDEVIDEIVTLRQGEDETIPVRVQQRIIPNAGGEIVTQSFVVPQPTRPLNHGGDVKRLVRLLDDAPIAVAVTNLDGMVLEANDGLAAITGGAARVGAEIALAVRLEDRVDVEARLKAVANGAAAGSPLDIKLTGQAGREHEAQFHAHRITTDEGNLLLAYVIDISERKVIEQQLAQAQKMQAVGKLAGGIAHDVNNVLTAVRGHCDLLMLRHFEGDPDFGHLTQIRSQTERAAEVISHLLAFSRRQTMRKEVTRLAETLDEIRFMLNPLMTERIDVRTQHDPDLHPVRIDRSEFQRVVMNLALNAGDAMPNGGALSIRTRNIGADEVRSRNHKGIVPAEYVLIEVEDTGTGISDDDLEQIFEPFFTTKGVGKGTGLGLSTVYGIVKQMDGFVYCSSTRGKGTTFQIYLPPYSGPAEVVKPVKTPDKAAPVDLSGTGRVLLVEDEEAVRSFATKALELRGYSVIAAASGEEALEAVREAPKSIDLIVSDVVMPEMTGPEMMRKVREISPDVRFIFISGYAEDAFRDEMMEGETFEFLAKPFSLKDLAVKVKEVLGAS